MRTLWKSAVLAAVVVAGLQTAALAWMIWDRVALLRSGREVVLPIVPVDPRSLFRGDYVILSYPFSRVSTSLAREPKPTPGAGFYVVLRKAVAEGRDDWQADRIVAAMPETLGADEIALKARPQHGGTIDWSRTFVLSVRYGIESYFVPEGKGRDLEAMVRDKKLAAIVAVDAKGNAAIKGLSVDGKMIYDAPLF